MITAIQKWGNSCAIRIPVGILEALSIKENDKVEILAEEETITIRKAVKKYKNLDELFLNYDGEYKCYEIDTGHSIGKEV